MNTLFLSFAVAIGGAIGLVSISKVFDIEMYTSRIFPLIPILYAIVYELMEKMKAGAAVIFQNITFGRVAADVGVSLAIKFTFEVVFSAFYLYFTGKHFTDLYGVFGIETIGRFLRGEHPWIAGAEGLYLLGLLAVITSFGTGLWIGYTSHAQAILEGVIVGAAATVIMAMTNMLILYRRIEELANQAASSMGYATHIGFAVVIAVQVLLYGLWSGVAQRAHQERIVIKAAKRSGRKTKR
jgi:hypothetical protein